MMKIYMAVTADEYELPLGVFDRPKEMADRYGMSAHVMHNYIHGGHERRKEHARFIGVEVDEKEETK